MNSCWHWCVKPMIAACIAMMIHKPNPVKVARNLMLSLLMYKKQTMENMSIVLQQQIEIFTQFCRPETLINPIDKYRSFNAAIETLFKAIKVELIWWHSWQTLRAVEATIFEYINGLYGPSCRHSTLDWKSPLAFERFVTSISNRSSIKV